MSQATPIEQQPPAQAKPLFDMTHATPIAGVQHDYSSLTANPKGQGTYKVSTPDGQTLAVPYSNVPVFTHGMQGFSLDPEDAQRFQKDAAADPHRPTFWNALTNPVAGGGRGQGVGGGALQVGGQAVKAMVQPLMHPVQTVESAVKTGSYVAGHALGVPMPEDWNPVAPMVEQYERDRAHGGHALALENLLGQALGMYYGGKLTGAAAGPALSAAARATGGGLQSAGEGLAESALGIRNTDRAFNSNPGRAALAETSGLMPSTIAEEAGQRLNDLTLERAAVAQANPGPVNISGARTFASEAMQEQARRNAIPQIDRMAPLAEQIRTQGEPRGGWPIGVRPPRPAGAGIPPFVETPEAINLREGVGGYSADKPWTGKASADPLRGMVRGMYGSMSDAIHTAVPEIEPLDARMHDLIPVAQRAGEVDLNASTLQRVAGRFARPTGALVGAVSGVAGGHMAAGLPGAIAGGLGGLVAPELLASPWVQMGVARGLNAVGEASRSAAPVAGVAAERLAPAAVVGGGVQQKSKVDAEYERLKQQAEVSRPGFYSDQTLREKAAFNVAMAEKDNDQK
jgi:hypothetical protein